MSARCTEKRMKVVSMRRDLLANTLAWMLCKGIMPAKASIAEYDKADLLYQRLRSLEEPAW